MATVVHGVKDGIDQILETTNAIERLLKARRAQVVIDSTESAEAALSAVPKLSAIDQAMVDITMLKSQASTTRNAIENVRRALS
jgi:hypothetical protein